jgi:predicted nucleic acid-binding protein
MHAEVFFDTSVLAYLMAADDPRSDIAEKLLAGGGSISVHVLNEFVAVARRKTSLSWDDIASLVGEICVLCGEPRSISMATHVEGLRIAKRYGYRIYDSLIIASALEAGCTILYSEDMQGGQRIGTLRIANPFQQKNLRS